MILKYLERKTTIMVVIAKVTEIQYMMNENGNSQKIPNVAYSSRNMFGKKKKKKTEHFPVLFFFYLSPLTHTANLPRAVHCKNITNYLTLGEKL